MTLALARARMNKAREDYIEAAAEVRRLSTGPVAPTDDLVASIQARVVEEYRTTNAELLSSSRSARIAEARHVAMWITSQLTPYTHAEIGLFFVRNHTSVSYALGVIDDRRSIEPAFAARTDALLAALSSP